MPQKSKLSTEQWVALLAKDELPAITSIAGILDKFSNDDTSSIPKLSKVILHDQALSSCLLRVANSSSRSPIHKVTTVSRAAIVLGVHSVKNICLTAKVLEGLLNNHKLVPQVYERLKKLMANAFFAGLLARMMVPDYEENTQEEVYLAAMMYNIGETSFWSTGSMLTRDLILKSGMPKLAFEQYCANQGGIKFAQISLGLARTWRLGDLLEKALDHPKSRTKEMNIISLSNQLSEAIGTPPKNRLKFDQLLQEVANLMGTDIRILKNKIEATRQVAIELLGSYNASMLESYLKPLPKDADFSTQAAAPKVPLTKEQAVLGAVKSLSELSKHSRNINDYLSDTLNHLSQIFHFERGAFWVLNSDKNVLQCRLAVDSDSQPIRFSRQFPVNDGANILTMGLQSEAPLFINDFRHARWQDVMTLDSEYLMENGIMCLSPVRVNSRSIGVLTAQFIDKSVLFSSVDFEHFSFITEHLNMCLSLVSRKSTGIPNP
ncbi:HDOD domain-containing protein [Aliiglaciecola sp. LCG003]|uniref:HDOD domain-containing protein n=1 Tax=Aliiglaciecola sp. LCG003 TaxID=3053655 RepID=UPI002573D493|nr:HDOD domain-containing protein [Aliiglaciecola sp. LCG003]WJG08565.1 HDOD domain-containing protein [Aliiglaciecola sp. LCG003]